MDFLQISGTAKGGSLFQLTVQASGETYELAATTQQERRRWVDQLLQAASNQAAAAQSPNGTGTDGHLLAPSPSAGMRQASDDRELHRGSVAPPPSPLGRRPSATQESVSTMRSQSLRGNFPEAQLPSPSTAQRAGQPLGSSSPAGHRSGQLFGSRSPTKGSSAVRLSKSSHPELQRGSDTDSLRSFSLRSSSGSVKRSLLASLSASFRNAIVPPHPSDMASSLSDTESLDILGLAPSSPYTASLQPLRRQGQESPKAVLLAPDALMEQFERAQQYVARHPEDFSLERLSSLQDWCDAAKSQGRSTDAGLAASAMYVLQVTQTSPMWASEHDTAFISPDSMIRSVQNCPSASMLTDLKDCLDFCSNSWVSLFCRQGGTALLLQALEVHADAADEPDAHEAMLVALQCMHALMSGAGGMHGVLSTGGFLPAVCAMLAHPGENEAAKLVVEMLIKLCLFSTESYCLAVKATPQSAPATATQTSRVCPEALCTTVGSPSATHAASIA
ncbi:g6743 [Coccomyxa viridis]|uniref:G6743 protein n=1 Tax=Coccomyxa viridis TaxID=1274662 RepID=A0ABP1FXC4_9CHLO